MKNTYSLLWEDCFSFSRFFDAKKILWDFYFLEFRWQTIKRPFILHCYLKYSANINSINLITCLYDKLPSNCNGQFQMIINKVNKKLCPNNKSMTFLVFLLWTCCCMHRWNMTTFFINRWNFLTTTGLFQFKVNIWIKTVFDSIFVITLKYFRPSKLINNSHLILEVFCRSFNAYSLSTRTKETFESNVAQLITITSMCIHLCRSQWCQCAPFNSLLPTRNAHHFYYNCSFAQGDSIATQIILQLRACYGKCINNCNWTMCPLCSRREKI